MAEDEIRKHTKAIYDAAKAPGKSWSHKLKEILLEIAIIVFAVTVSIWLHNWSDVLKDRKEEKEFLTGIKNDLQIDIGNLAGSRKFYEDELSGTKYFMQVAGGGNINPDSLQKYNNIFSASTNLEANSSRYTTLKGSGKFDIVENKELLNKIIEVHEVLFSHVQVLDNIFNDYNATKTEPYAFEHLQLDSSWHVLNVEQVVRTSQMRFYLVKLNSLIEGNIIPYHSAAIEKCENIIKEIDDELK